MTRQAAVLLLLCASSAQAGPELARKIREQTGIEVSGGRRVEGQLRAPDQDPLYEPVGGAPERAWVGEQLFLPGGMLLDRLAFASEAAALEYADVLLRPNLDIEGRAVVEVRGRYLVALRSDRAGDPALVDLAVKLLPVVWAAGGPAGESPRAYLGLRDERGMAIESVPAGPLQGHVQAALDKAREKFPAVEQLPGSPERMVEWTGPARDAFRFTSSDGAVRMTVDASGPRLRVAQGSAESLPVVTAELARLGAARPRAGVVPVGQAAGEGQASQGLQGRLQGQLGRAVPR